MTTSGEGDPPDDATRGEDTAATDENVVRVDFRRGARVADTAGPAADEKLRVFRDLVAHGMVMVTLDARRPGVNVPSRFAQDAQLNLNFSHRFGVADFSYDERGVRATLTFGGHPFFCDVPWGAVWGMRSHVDNPDQVTVFHDALPEELLQMLPQSAREQIARAQERRQAERSADRPAEKHVEKHVDKPGASVAGRSAGSPSLGDGARPGLRLVRPPPSGEGAPSPDDEPETIPDKRE